MESESGICAFFIFLRCCLEGSNTGRSNAKDPFLAEISRITPPGPQGWWSWVVMSGHDTCGTAQRVELEFGDEKL